MKSYLNLSLFFLSLLFSLQRCEAFGESFGKMTVEYALPQLKQMTKELIQGLNGVSDKLLNIAHVLKDVGSCGGGALMYVADAAKNIGINSAEITAQTVEVMAGALKEVTHKVTRVAWAGIGTAATYISYRVGTGIYDRYDKRCQENEITSEKRVLLSAKQALLAVLVKNSHNKNMIFGIPEGCEKEASALLALPGGKEEFEKIREMLSKHGGE